VASDLKGFGSNGGDRDGERRIVQLCPAILEL